MNPDTTTQAGNLDPSSAALAKSIALTEGMGKVNYNAVGDGGNSFGAYQMSKQFMDEYGPKNLPNYQSGNYNLSPEQQDQLAYNTVNQFRTQGDPSHQSVGPMTPAQIASRWNSGDPNAYINDPSSGRNNAYGGIGNYVSAAEKYYSQFSGSQNPTDQSASSQPSPTQSQQNPSWLPNIPTPPNPLQFLGGLASLFSNPTVQKGLALGGGLTAGLATGNPLAGLGAYGAINAAEGALGGNQPPAQGQDTTQTPPKDLNTVIPQETQATKQASTSALQALASTPTGAVQARDTNVQNAINTASSFGAVLRNDVNGRVESTPAQSQIDSVVSQLSNGWGAVAAAEGKDASIQEAVREAQKGAHQYAPSHEWSDIDQNIKGTAEEYAKNFGTVEGKTYGQYMSNTPRNEQGPKHDAFMGNARLKLSDMERMRHETGNLKWNSTNTSAKIHAMKALYFGARKTIENNTEHKEFFNKAMKIESDLLTAKKIYKKLDGKKAPGNKQGLLHGLMHAGGRYASLYIGDRVGGPIGAIVGDMVGNKIIHAADKKYGKTIFETPGMRKAIEIAGKNNPAIGDAIKQEISKASAENYNRTPQLPNGVISAPPRNVKPNKTDKNNRNQKKNRPRRNP